MCELWNFGSIKVEASRVVGSFISRVQNDPFVGRNRGRKLITMKGSTNLVCTATQLLGSLIALSSVVTARQPHGSAEISWLDATRHHRPRTPFAWHRGDNDDDDDAKPQVSSLTTIQLTNAVIIARGGGGGSDGGTGAIVSKMFRIAIKHPLLILREYTPTSVVSKIL